MSWIRSDLCRNVQNERKRNVKYKSPVLLMGMFATVWLAPADTAQTPEVRTLWEIEAEGGFSSPNFVRESSSGKIIGVVANCISTGLIFVEPDGSVGWKIPMNPPIPASPAVIDINSDGEDEILAVDRTGHLICVNRRGRILWQRELPDGITGWTGPAAADLDNDGKVETIVGDRLGNVSCYRCDGTLRWRFQGETGELGTPLVVDLYDCTGLEIIITSHEQDIYALDSKGNWLWDIHVPNDLFPNSTPVLADIDGTGRGDLFVGGGLNHLFRIDPGTPEIRDTIETGQHINAAISVGDLRGEGREIVLAGNKSGTLYAYGTSNTSDGGLIWQKEFPGQPLYAAPLLLNLDEDPDVEILVFLVQEGSMVAIDPGGSLLWRIEQRTHALFTPCAGDLDGDGMLDLVIPTTPHSGGMGNLRCISLGTPYREHEVLWSSYAGGPANTCRAENQLRHTPIPVPPPRSRVESKNGTFEGSTELFTGSNIWRRTINNPDRRRLVLLTEVCDPHGFRFLSAKHTRRETENILIPFCVEKKGTYRIHERLLDADSRSELVSKEHSISFAPIQTDVDYMESVQKKASSNIQKWENPNVTVHNCFVDRAAELMDSISSYADTARHFSEKGQGIFRNKFNFERFVQRLATTRLECDRFFYLTRAVTTDAAQHTFIPWTCSPWSYFDAWESLPPSNNDFKRIEVAACVGEYEPFVVNLANVSGKTLEIRVTLTEMKGLETLQAYKHIEVRRAAAVPTDTREKIADALPLLDQGQLLTVPPWESAQLWLTFDAIGVGPGVYESTLRLYTLEVDPSTVDIPIRFTVHDLSLPRPRPLRFCTWSYVTGHFRDMEEHVRQDLVEHANTVFLGSVPKAEFDASGNLKGEIDYTEHDKFIRKYAPHGFILFLSPQHGVRGPEFLSQAWRRGYTTFLKDWVNHLGDLGVGYDGFAFYPYDEPNVLGSEVVNNLIAVGKATRAVDPNILIYTDPTTGTTVELYEALAPYIDIWCPSAELLERHGDTLVPLFKKTGKEVWMYDAAGHAQTLSTLGIYRWRPWNAWQLGLTGVGHWVYSAHSDDLWRGPNPSGDYFPTVYDGKGVVTSKRWEACREGAEDYEYLYLLREHIRKAKTAGRDADAIADAETLLQRAPEITALLLNVGRRIPLRNDGVSVYENATNQLNLYRREIIEACLKLK